ncbi:hypothetical protein D9613_005767 [Agrocybe pediades]|uniref:tRNA-splicing endonuclease subunit Sen54 N-terminal domain-containing protein n=1 Tax=Agrocybe pediades TaxID=84607 RepID=A0A8H4VQ40_9AGAR|nr:hypothetical protein D9613_005767 [Agrocybe pediades]
MDDSLEEPTSHLEKVPATDQQAEDQEEQSSDEEDGGLDWTKIMPASARPIIPKRGEKEFEPRAGGGTNLQLHVLDRSRAAMLDTLRATRTISSKVISYATWYPAIARAHVTVPRGIHFSNMGHSAPRPVSGEESGTTEKIQKRLELLPEEAIYLIERGSLFCWKQIDLDVGQVPGLHEIEGSPMSVQQAYSEMIGREGLTIEKFQVYAYLKRLGYVVTRTDPPDSYYPCPPSALPAKPTLSILERVKAILSPCFASIFRCFNAFNWWKPLRISRWLHHDKNYAYIYRSLRFMSSGHKVPLKSAQATLSKRDTSPYKIFFNLYKPSTPFKKSAPPPPDFQVVVINARTTPMPTLQELTDLFDVLPEMPLPPPRQRKSPIGGLPATTPPPTPKKESQPVVVPSPSFIHKFFPWFFSKTASPAPLARKINPFMALKTGKKTIIIAVVDASSTSFFRFGQGEFTEWPMA